MITIKLLQKLEGIAKDGLVSSKGRDPALMHPFPEASGGSRMACPWLEAWRKIHGEKSPKEGVMLLQDWDVFGEGETLDRQVELICVCVNKGAGPERDGDRTLRNLLPTPKKGWNEAFAEGRWLITNAVWGLRPTCRRKSGYLGRKVHAAAFPVWAELLVDLASERDSGNCRPIQLVVAGAWGRFDPPQTNPADLAGYLRAWNAYVGGEDRFAGADLSALAGEVSYCHHPAVWGSGMRFYADLAGGPPPK